MIISETFQQDLNYISTIEQFLDNCKSVEQQVQKLINALLILLDSRAIQNALRLVGDIGRDIFQLNSGRKNIGFELDFLWHLMRCKSNDHHFTLMHYVSKIMGPAQISDLIFELKTLKKAIVQYDSVKENLAGLAFSATKMKKILQIKGLGSIFLKVNF